MVQVTGLVRKADLAGPGGITTGGGRVRIGGGSPQAQGGNPSNTLMSGTTGRRPRRGGIRSTAGLVPLAVEMQTGGSEDPHLRCVPTVSIFETFVAFVRVT